MVEQKRHTSAPERPQIKEHIVVTGGGIMGMTSAWMLSEAGYNVTLFDQMAEPMLGTSKDALGIHLGGRYPHSPQTAEQCLDSGILFKKLMPFAVSETNGPLNFLVANNSLVDYKDYVEFYAQLRDKYAKRSINEQHYGAPETFFRELSEEELVNFTNIAGGIATQEAVYDMPQAKRTLTKSLQARGVRIASGIAVVGIDKPEDQYEITWKGKDGTFGVTKSDYVINTAGQNARMLSQQLGVKPSVNLQLRFFNDIAIDSETEKAYPGAYVLVPGGPGRDAMHYVPLVPGRASLVGFSETIDANIVEEGKDLALSRQWQETAEGMHTLDHSLSQQIIDIARTKYMPLLDPRAQIVDMRPGVAVSFSSSQYDKTHEGLLVADDLPGFLTAVPTKASHAITLGLELVTNVTEQSLEKNVINRVGSYVQQIREGETIWHYEA